MTSTPSEDELSNLFALVQRIGVFSRLRFNWINPRGSDFAKGAMTSQVSSTTRNIDNHGVADAMEFLETLASTRKISVAWLECVKSAQPVVPKLIDTVARTKELLLRLNLSDAFAVSLFRALERNRSVSVLEIRCLKFGRESAAALARMVKRNRSMTTLKIDLREHDRYQEIQLLSICRELEEAIPRNRFLLDVQLRTKEVKRYNDSIIRSAIRRNHGLVNQALRFIKGSMKKEDALAFEILQNCASLRLSLRVNLNTSDESDMERYIDEARKRLSFDYFVLVGVVKAKIACHPHLKGSTRFDKLSKLMQAHICSFLSLTDVVDC
ncbi:hypothetical protein HPB52_025434 [Rhipicephalus sanguineus]|uniref:Uncharacterized protein n=1 Tax=Rhipicephalus sanguineus TaxID=34632 RepID=A0A9D4TCZ2_RHISA|nr:hypothetical protein HPB52_025434 [Rhipicephalus sanguineus]